MSDVTPIPIRPLGDSPPADDPPLPEVTSGSIGAALGELVAQVVVIAAETLDDLLEPDEEAARLLHAGAGFLLEAARAAGTIVGSLERSAVDLARGPSGAPIVDHWEAIWRDRIASDEQADRTREALDRVLTRLDLTAIVRRNLDINAVVADLDPDPIVARMDMDALVDRIDIDALAARIDVGALIDRLDLTALAAAVIDELDLAELIRQASSEATSEEVGRLRLRSVEADRAVQRAVDAVLRRRRER